MEGVQKEGILKLAAMCGRWAGDVIPLKGSLVSGVEVWPGGGRRGDVILAGDLVSLGLGTEMYEVIDCL